MTKQNFTFLFTFFLCSLQNGSSGDSFIDALERTNNDSTNFILLKICEAPHLYNSKKRQKGYELHHIVPTHANGPDIAENCICFSVQDHGHAHLLLYQIYGSSYDFCAYKMREGKSQEAFDALRKANVEKMRNEKRGRFDSQKQSECGKKNKGVVKKPHTKLERVAAAMQRGMIWQHDDGTVVHILPGQCKGTTEVVDLLLFGFSKEKQENYAQRKSKSPVYCGINRLMSGYRDPKTNKACYCAGPWRLLGVLL